MRALPRTSVEAGSGGATVSGLIVPTPTPPPRPAAGIPTSDKGRTERFADWLDGDFLYIYSWKTWAYWDEGNWRIDPSGNNGFEITRKALEFADVMMEEADAYPPGTAQATAAIAAARQFQSNDHIKSMISLLRAMDGIAVQPTDFDADPMVLGVKNGKVDLKTGEHSAVEKEDMLLKKCGVSYDKKAKFPMWEEFLEQILPDPAARKFLKRAIGYGLTGMTTEQVLFFFFGMGQNGKSTFIETIEYILGAYAWRTSAELFLETRASDNKMNMLAALPEMRFVVGAEMPEGGHLAENRIKDLCSGERIQARKLFCEPFNYYPTHKLFFYGNHRPVVKGSDKGIWRRLLLVPFTVEIPDAKRDRKIVARLKKEAPGILNWAIEGCLEWQASGLDAPESVKMATAEYQEEEDLIGQFIEEECQLTGEIAKHVLTAHFEVWAKSRGYKYAPSPRAVTDRAKRVPGIKDKKVRGARMWVGLSMKDEAAFPKI